MIVFALPIIRGSPKHKRRDGIFGISAVSKTVGIAGLNINIMGSFFFLCSITENSTSAFYINLRLGSRTGRIASSGYVSIVIGNKSIAEIQNTGILFINKCLSVDIDAATAKGFVSQSLSCHGIVDNVSLGNIGYRVSFPCSCLDINSAPCRACGIITDGSPGHIQGASFCNTSDCS